MKLLNTNGGNAKIKKTESKQGEYKIASLSLMPDIKICPAQIMADCKADCLVSAGRGKFHNVAISRQTKTEFWHNDKEAFLEQLKKEMHNFEKLCHSKNKKACFRLNTISDIPWEKYGIPQAFPNSFLYDYTKVASRLSRTPENYKLMFSYSAAPGYQNQVHAALKTDVPISAVFRGGMPSSFLNRKVIDGDLSDLDNLFSGKVIVGLKLKGGKHIQKSKSPFIVDNPEIMKLAA